MVLSRAFHYGGQAVIEGVMIRGQKSMTMAIRRGNNEIITITKPLKAIYTGRIGAVPLVRGLVSAAETVILGARALLYSANISLEKEEEVSSVAIWGMLALALAFALGIFFVTPTLIMGWLDSYIDSPLISNVVEGIIRLGIFVIYLKVISVAPDIQRVFAYHGAEHKTINAYEDGVAMEVAAVRGYSTAHARCGTAFLLTVLVVAFIVFALLGRPPLWLRLLSRIALLPVIAGISYELMRLGAAHTKNRFIRAILSPGLALQSMTTREPDDQQIEVAMAALKGALVADGVGGEALAPQAATPEKNRSYSRCDTRDP